MNQIEIQELTTHLSQALDQNYDVVNMDAVLCVICALEGTTITKEQLEATRLAKYINQLRRRTKNEHLARRAKSLLKKWREMVGIQQTATEYLAHPSQISSSQPALNLVKSPINSFITEPIAPSQQIVSDMHSNIDSAEPPLLGEHTLLHPSFSNLVNSIKDSDRHENIAITTFHTHKDRRHSHAIRSCHVASPQPIVIDHSINSVINLTEDSTVKINETSVVIDIASDSDENDNNRSLNPKKLNSIVPAPLPTPSTPSSRQRKLKKEKRSKEREGQVASNTRFGAKVSDTFQQAALTTDSDTSMHSPHILETLSGSAIFASKIDDLANTDSDTVTSDPSHDSNKSQEIKECTSLDSNSNSVQSLPLANNRENLIPKNVNDITTQLMHLIHSLNSPLSIIEIERVYQEKIIPCTCIVIEEVEGTLGESNNCTLDDQSKNAKISLNSKDNLFCHNQDNFPTSQRSINGEVIDTQPKLVKSIFDLDFDDNDDPLNLIMDEIQKPIARAEELKNNKSDTKNIHFGASAQNVSFNINFSDDAQQDNSNQEREKSETQNAIPAFTVHEDPDCLARQRFYIQTNKVTSFHINALHNYYIPNINGNWDSVESFTSFQPKHTIMDTMESYTVTNGADVVPKYGLLTSDRIRKDLSSLKSIKPYRVKKFTSLFSPFLGVAKCLPTCRRARRRLKNFVTLSTANDNTAKNFESLENMKASFKNCNPLNVKIDGTTSAIYSHNENHVPMQVNTNVEQLPPSQSFSGNAISYNLLKLADDKVRDDEISDKSSNHGCQENSPYSSSSSSGYSDSKEDQHNIIKNQQNKSIQLNSRNSDMNRRKRRIYLEDDSKKKKHYRKRIKAAVNGTCSNLHRNLNSSDSENGMENDYKNEYGNSNNEEYAIVQRPAGDGENCRNHIVLTIKKTPSKINSPANSMNAFSPSSTSDAANLKKSILDFCLEDTNISQSITEIPQKKKEDLSKSNRIVHQSRCSAYRRIFRKSDKSQTKFIDLELKHLFHLKSNPPCILANSKLHNKLFFPHELSMDNTSGIRERIINYSSSSSSSYDDDSEVENTSFVKKANVKKCSAYNNHNLKTETETCAATAISEFKFESDEDSMLTSLGDSDIDIQDEIHATNDSVDYCNDFQNNKMLESFNSIFVDSLRTNTKNESGNMESSPHITSLESLKPENVDAISRYCNNNNLGVNLSNELSNTSAKSIKSLDSTEKLPSLGNEHCTGIKTSSDLASTSIADKKLTRIQQFKEWHQVLQLKSYNNEPLIVLPYVLLE
nr:mediator of RNA polymerase II transcription subunit 26 isoform X3 [Drosophila simulans]